MFKIIQIVVLIYFVNIAYADSNKEILIKTKSCISCDLRDIDLSNENLRYVNLSGANLSGANLTQTDLQGANLQGAILLRLDLSETKLNGANLKKANLSDLDIDLVFEYVEIMGTQLEGARFKDDVICGKVPKKGGWGCEHP